MVINKKDWKVKIRNFNKIYNGRPIYEDLNLNLYDNSTVFLKNYLESKNSFIITFLIFLFSIYFFEKSKGVRVLPLKSARDVKLFSSN